MKKLIILPLLLIFTVSLHAQQKAADKTLRTIAVEGKAEKEIAPDIIYFSITLKEYTSEDGKKVSITNLEKQLSAAVKNAGIAAEDLVVENIYGYNYNWREKENKNFEARKQFQLKVNSPTMVNKVISQVDEKGIQNARVAKYTHSRIDEITHELQVEAIENAREKAIALLKPLGESLGRVIEVQENAGRQPIYYQNESRMMAMDASSGGTSSQFKDIKIETTIQLVFAIE